MNTNILIEKAANIISHTKNCIVFTGAGVSVESGVPTFRGDKGLWKTYNPEFLDLQYFYKYPEKSWNLIYEIFYEFFGKAKPNAAHKTIAELEKLDIVKGVITQNIDNLHKLAGSNNVIEFHGSSSQLICTGCQKIFSSDMVYQKKFPLFCTKCKSLLKPDFTFFNEPIKEPVLTSSKELIRKAKVVIIIGTAGQVLPAATLPQLAKNNGAYIIEINVEPSNYTEMITDLYIQGEAGKIMPSIFDKISF